MNKTAQTFNLPDAEDGPLAHALETLTRLSTRSGEQLQHGLIEASAALTQAAGSLLEEAKSQSRKVAKSATREIQDRPIATTASIVLASAALISLMISLRKHSEANLADGGGKLYHERESQKHPDKNKRLKDS
ncbi:MAG: hypothetical protein GC205_09950 [Bacteroidetes bacterium]|nr:hypothetical protein [Bacteroidota bacterium]